MDRSLWVSGTRETHGQRCLLLFERGLAGEGRGTSEPGLEKLERWEGLGAGGTREGELARQGVQQGILCTEVVSRACPPSAYHLLWLHLPGRLQVAPALCSCFQKTGFERADSGVHR